MLNLETVEEFEKLQNSDQIVVFIFSAAWCPDCLYIKPFLPELVGKYKEIQFVYVNRDQFIDLCIDYDILGIPSFLAYKSGKEISRFVSKNRKTKEEIELFLGELL